MSTHSFFLPGTFRGQYNTKWTSSFTRLLLIAHQPSANMPAAGLLTGSLSIPLRHREWTLSYIRKCTQISKFLNTWSVTLNGKKIVKQHYSIIVILRRHVFFDNWVDAGGNKRMVALWRSVYSLHCVSRRPLSLRRLTVGLHNTYIAAPSTNRTTPCQYSTNNLQWYKTSTKNIYLPW